MSVSLLIRPSSMLAASWRCVGIARKEAGEILGRGLGGKLGATAARTLSLLDELLSKTCIDWILHSEDTHTHTQDGVDAHTD